MAISPFSSPYARAAYLAAVAEEELQRVVAAIPDHDFPVGWDERDSLV